MRKLKLPPMQMLILLTLLLGVVFKLAAFARETFIASRFGFSVATDAYFSLQSLPLAVASFMFGPFCRAFSPAYADSRQRNGSVAWLPGLMLYATLFALALTAIAFESSSLVLQAFTKSPSSDSWSTLAILNLCYWPIVQIGIFAGISTSSGKNIASLTATGLPYLLMTVALGVIYVFGKLSVLSLPISMTAGFAIAGGFSILRISTTEHLRPASLVLRPWAHPEFRRFLRQLGASSLENVGYSLNQFLILYFMARAVTGSVSANNCASRIGLLGFSLLAQPLVQLLQARLCTSSREDQQRLFKVFLSIMSAGTIGLAALICAFRWQVTALIYMRGRLSVTAVHDIVALLVPWLAYFVVLSLNATAGVHLFRTSRGPRFTRNMLCGYAIGNIIRFAVAAMAPVPWIIWCSVLGDGSALLANLTECLGRPERFADRSLVAATSPLMGQQA